RAPDPPPRRAAEASEAQLRASEERLRQQSQQLGIVLGAIAEGVTAQDVTGRLLFANDAAARISGFPNVDALLQAPLDQFVARFELFDDRGRAFDWSSLPGRRALAGDPNPEVV